MDLNTKLNQIFNFLSIKRAHNCVKMHTRVIKLCLPSPLMIVSKCSKYESNIYDTLGVKWTKTQNLTKFSSIKGP